MSKLNDDQIDKIRNKLQIITGGISLLKMIDKGKNEETIVDRMDKALNEVIKVLNDDI